MRTAQVICAATMIATLPLSACNRPESRDKARVAAAEVKNVAGRASEKLADSWLATKIQAQYFADNDVKARNILVSAHDGVVTLKGRVDSPNAHEQALQIAKNTDGVRSVSDLLTLGAGPAAQPGAAVEAPSTQAVATSGLTSTPEPPIAERLNDSGITASIQSKYFVDSNIKARRIDVETHQGVVTLHGEVASDDERAQALILARTTDGVQRVEDSLTVNLAAQSAPAAQVAAAAPAIASAPPVAAPAAATAAVPAQAQDATLTSLIESQFAADRQIKGAGIDVMAKDGVVLLEGTVPTTAVKQRMLSLARRTKGVIQVVDRVKVGRAR